MDARITRTRDTVLAAALAVLLDEGLTAVTPTRVAERSGVARRTLYRHWPTADDLVHDALANASFPTYPRTGDPARDVRAHLEQLRTALQFGPLSYILLALGERAAVDPAMALVRDRLVAQGCAPLRSLLADHGVEPERITDLVDELEGPVLASALVHGRAASDAVIDGLVARAVAAPGIRSSRIDPPRLQGE